MIGLVMLERRNLGPAGRVRPDSGEVDLGYLFLPDAWGCGYATEACAAALAWFTGVFPGEPVVLCTQTANHRSMGLAAKLGFTGVQRYEKYGAEVVRRVVADHDTQIASRRHFCGARRAAREAAFGRSRTKRASSAAASSVSPA
jgi:RimJ/RimL family protein N-acetyltransferase